MSQSYCTMLWLVVIIATLTHAELTCFGVTNSNPDVCSGSTCTRVPYLFRETLNIENNMEEFLPAGYTTYFEVDTSELIANGKLTPSCHDLRVYYYNGSATIEIKRHIRDHSFACGSSTTKVWFNTQKDIPPWETDSDYYLLYGNTTDIEPPILNSKEIYLFMDDFTSTKRFSKSWRNNSNGTLQLSTHDNRNTLAKARKDGYGGYGLIGSEISQFELTAVFQYASHNIELNDAINFGMVNEKMLGYIGSVRMKSQREPSFSIKKSFDDESLAETAAANNHPKHEWITVTLRKPSKKLRLLSSVGGYQLNSLSYSEGSEYNSFDRVVLYGDASVHVQSVYVRKIETSEPLIRRSEAISPAPNTCTCKRGMFGKNCTRTKSEQRVAQKKRAKAAPRLLYCNGVAAGAPNVCSGHGDCNALALFTSGCDCDTGYSGGDCQYWYCNSILYSSASVCSTNGTCTSPNVCACKTGFTGTYCSSWSCNSVDRLSASVCSTNGTCVYPSICMCKAGFTGAYCSSWSCGGIDRLTASVCSTNGTCIAPSTCNCKSGFSGTNCENYYCNSIIYTNNAGCSTNGTCIAPNTCSCKSGFYGTWCQNWNCNSVAMNSASVCSTNGTCISPDLCNCKSGFYGNNCQSWNCNSIIMSNNAGCSTNGTCIAPNTCNCKTGYYGTWCQNWNCNGVAMNSASVCSTNGTCVSPDVCNCKSGFSGSNCQNWYCNAILYSSASVCSTNGTCVAPSTCSCKSGYYGTNCEYWSCNGIAMNSASACSTNGTCVAPNTCSCKAGFYGSNCESWSCNSIIMSNDAGCSSNGTCVASSTCSCKSGYYGSACQNWNCNAIAMSSNSVCSTNGSCISPNVCSCKSGYYGSNCESWNCNNIIYTNNAGCSSNGTCIAPNTCNCKSGFYGTWCQTWNCNGVAMDSASVCSTNGTCVATDTCICKSGFYGSNCQNWNCNSIAMNSASVCSTNGTCVAPDTCSCKSGFYGSTCQNWNCNGIAMNSASVCSTNGTCISPDTCWCKSGFTGAYCSSWSCNGVDRNSASVCSTNGTCIAPSTCMCKAGFYGTDCESWNCNSVAMNSVSVCSTNGTCVSPDVCSCKTGYSGSNCQNYYCGGILYSSGAVCSTNGTCVAPSTCSCKPGFSGANCENYYCNSIIYTNNAGCSTNGTCVAPSTCSCKTGFYGSTCENWNCNGVAMNSASVCSTNGTCVAPDTCSCKSGFSGSSCQNYYCGGVLYSSGTVCSTNGTCTGPSTCTCKSGYYGTTCESWTCNGVAMNSAGVCSTNGSCVAPNTCSCRSGFYGSNCENWNCNGIAYSSNSVCSTNGTCTAPDVCTCNSGYYGSNCENWKCNNIIMTNNAGCSSNGTCVAPSVCNCQSGYYGASCATWSCNGVDKNLASVCSTNGSCTAPSTCTCNAGFSGFACQDWFCNSVKASLPTVCSSNGSCVAPEVCVCRTGYYGSNCENWRCNSVAMNSNTVCSSNGTCTAPDTCYCNTGYAGTNCEQWLCGTKLNTDPTVCSGHGLCTSPGVCDCNSGYFGSLCSNTPSPTPILTTTQTPTPSPTTSTVVPTTTTVTPTTTISDTTTIATTTSTVSPTAASTTATPTSTPSTTDAPTTENPTTTATPAPTTGITPTTTYISPTSTVTPTTTPTTTDEPTTSTTGAPSTNPPTTTVQDTTTTTPATATPTTTSTVAPTTTMTDAPTTTDTPTPTAGVTPTTTGATSTTSAATTTAPTTDTPTPTVTITDTPTPTDTPSATAAQTVTPTDTPTPTPTDTATPTSSASVSDTPTATPTDTPTASNTATPSLSSVSTTVPTVTPAFNTTASLAPTTGASTLTDTVMPTLYVSNTSSVTSTATPTSTVLPITPTATPTGSVTPSTSVSSNVTLPTIIPTVGSVDTTVVGPGNTITITGTSFSNASTCQFNSGVVTVVVQATFINDTLIQCTVPSINSFDPNVPMYLDVSSDGVTYNNASSQQAIDYVSTTVPVLSSIDQATVGPGSSVTIHGEFFFQNTTCRYTAGGIIVYSPGVFLNSTVMQCEVPSNISLNSSMPLIIDVSNDGVNYSPSTSQALVFVPTPIPTLIGIDQQTIGPGTIITVQGNGFTANSTCVFSSGSTESQVEVLFINATIVQCIVPMNVSTNDSQVVLSVSNDGVTISNSQTLVWTATQTPTVNSIPQQAAGPGNYISVTGGVFVNSTCRFVFVDEVYYTPAEIVDNSTILCLVPTYSHTVGLNQTTLVRLDVSNDGTTFSTSTTQNSFPYVDTAVPTLTTTDHVTITAGSVITLVGTLYTNESVCIFNEQGMLTSLPALYINSTMIQCIAPNYTQSSNVLLSVSNDGSLFTSNSVTFAYVQPIAPPTVNVIGDTTLGPGNQITITGSGFHNTSTCRFSIGGTTVVVSAIFINDTEIICELPSNNFTFGSNYTISGLIEISNDGTNYSPTQSIHFVAAPVPVIDSIGQSTVGPGTQVTITGDLFTNSSTCRFTVGNSSIVVPAVSIASNSMVCIVPSNYTVSTTMLLDVSNDESTYSSIQAALNFVNIIPPTIQAIDQIVVGPGNTISVIGQDFTNSTTCQFTSATVNITTPVVFINSTLVQCMIPIVNVSIGQNTSVVLQLDNNGVASNTQMPVVLVPTIVPSIQSFSTSDSDYGPGTTIIVTGSSMTNPFCKFTIDGQEYIIPAVNISLTQVSCIVPSYNASGTMTLSLSNDGSTFTTGNGQLTFNYVAPPTISSIDATIVGPGNSIGILGSSFTPNTTCEYSIGDYVATVPAVYMNSTKVTCPVPNIMDFVNGSNHLSSLPNNGTIMQLAVSNNGHTLSSTLITSIIMVSETIPVVDTISQNNAQPGTVLTIVGSLFTNSSTCRFTLGVEEVIVPSQYTNSGHIQCITPQFNGTGVLQVSVSNDGQTWTISNTKSVSYSQAPNVQAIGTTIVGPDNSITVLGTGFTNSSTCKFTLGNSSVIVSSVYINSTLIECITPELSQFNTSIPSNGTQVELAISNDGSTYTSGGAIPPIILVSTPVPTIGSIDVTNITPGSSISINGTSFSNSSTCKFVVGGHVEITPAVLISTTQIQCTTPLLNATNQVQISVSNDANTYSSPVTVQYTQPPSITAIDATAVGPGNTVTVTGSSFANSSECRFVVGGYQATVPATLVGGKLECIVPSLDQFLLGNQIATNALLPSSIQVLVSSDGVSFYGNNGLPSIPLVSTTVPDVQGLDKSSASAGTVIAVSGTLLSNSSTCRFTIGNSTTTVSATFVSTSQVECIVPDMNATGVVTLSISNDNVTYTTGNSFTLNYASVTPPAVSSLEQTAVGPGNTITVSGSAFTNLSTCKLTVGDYVFIEPAIFVNDTRIICAVPNLDSFTFGNMTLNANALLQNTTMLVSISNDGQSFWPSPTLVTVSNTVVPSVQFFDQTNVSPGTVITATGSDFTNTTTCRFSLGNYVQVIPAVVFSTNQVQCIAPPLNATGTLTLSISNDGYTYTSVNSYTVPYTLPIAPPVVTSLDHTLIGPGTSVNIVGSSFTNSSTCRYTIGSQVVDTIADFVNSSSIICVTPLLNVTTNVTVQLSISNDGVTFTNVSSGVNYIPYPIAVITSVDQTSVGPNTLVKLVGELFSNSSLCRFTTSYGVAYVPAIVIDNTEIYCQVPNFNNSGTVTLDVSSDGMSFIAKSNEITLQYTVPPLPSVQSMDSTVVGPGSIIVIQGSSFTNQTTCKFETLNDVEVVPATMLNNGTILCMTPSMNESLFGNISITVSISNNGHDYISSGTIQYVTTPVPVVQAINKANVYGGDVVSITGSLLTNQTTCRFSANGVVIETLAVYVNSTQVQCTVPTFNTTTTIALSISNDNNVYTSVGTPITYTSAPQISSIGQNTIGPGGDIAIVGSSFTNTTVCKFSVSGIEIVVPAMYVNQTYIFCALPLNISSRTNFTGGTIQVSVSNDGTVFVSSNTTQMYAQTPVISGVDVTSTISGANITVSGAFFTETSKCTFTVGSTIIETPTTYITSTQVTCTVPELNTTTVVSFSITQNGTSSTSTTISVAPRTPTVQQIESTILGPGNSITITGSSFTNQTSCKFEAPNNIIIVPATLTGNGTVSCLVPSLNVSIDAASNISITLSVSNNGVDYSITGSASYVTTPVPIVQSVNQTSIHAGDVVTVTGLLLRNQTTCRFEANGQVIVTSAVFVSGTTVQCAAPKYNTSTSVTLSISNDGHVYTALDTPLSFTSTPQISSIAQTTVGPGSNVYIVGSSFTNTSVCKFTIGANEILVPATFVNESYILCTIPVNSSTSINVTDGNVQISVSNDGSLFVGGNTTQTYAQVPLVSSIDTQVAVQGTNITVSGSFFTSSAMCTFSVGSTIIHVPITIVSNTSVTCTVPNFNTNTINTASLTITQNGSSSSASTFTLAPAVPQVQQVATTVVGPGSSITVVGSSFINGTTCHFSVGGVTVEIIATYFNSTLVECPVPLMNVSVIGQNDTVPIQLSLSNDGISFTQPQGIQYCRPSPIAQLTALDQPNGGYGTPITIHGSLFTSNATCIFTVGSTVITVPATNIQTSSIVCTAPFLNTSIAQVVKLTVSNDADSLVTGSSALNFTYVPQIIQSLAENVVGPGNVIAVFGTSFTNTSRCIFTYQSSTVDVNAEYVNSTLIYCPVPTLNTSSAETTVTVSISNDGANYIASPGTVTFVPTIVPSVQTTDQNSVFDGTTITITGSNFSNSSRCHFSGVTPAIAVYISDTQIQCMVPNFNASGSITLQVSNDGQHLIPSGVYQYTAPPIVETVDTSIIGPGSSVTVHGKSFTNSSVCRFTDGVTDIIFPAEFINATLLRCTLNATDAIQFVSATSVQLSISNDGSHFYLSDNTTMNYTPVPIATIASVDQTIVGPGSVVIVSGTLFTPNATCRFMSNGITVIVAATHNSESQIQCTTPVLQGNDTTLDVSNDGTIYSPSNVHIAYVSSLPPVITLIDTQATSSNEEINIFGRSLTNTTVCKFSIGGTEYIVNATFINSTLVQCTVPDVNTTHANLSLSVSNDGILFISSTQPLTYTETPIPVISSLDKQIASANSDIVISGSKFKNTTICTFTSGVDVITTPAVVISANEIVCKVPNYNSTTIVQLAISNDGLNYSPGQNITVVPQNSPVIVSDQSVVGPGNVITLTGTSFTNASTCKFEIGPYTAIVQVVYINASLVQCSVPDVSNFKHGNTSMSQLLANGSTVVVSVSNDGTNYWSGNTNTPITMVDTIVPSVDSINQSTTTLGSVITISGSDFTNSTTCQFKIGNIVQTTPAIVLGSTQIQCTTPLLNTTGTANVAVSNDGHTYTNDNTFTIGYASPPTVKSIDQTIVGPGNIITITGSSFTNTTTCQFTIGDFTATVTALVQNETSVACTVPPIESFSHGNQSATASMLNATSSIQVSISSDGNTYYGNNALPPVNIVPNPIPIVQSVNTTTVSPGGVISVRGSLFTNTSTCQFTIGSVSVSVPALVDSNSALRCVVPSINATGTVIVAMSNDNTTWTNVATAHYTATIPVITAVGQNVVGPGNTVILTGSSFSNHAICQFTFNSVSSNLPAKLINGTMVECTVPNFNTSTTTNSTILVSVSNDGTTFVSGGTIPYTSVQVASIQSIDSTSVSTGTVIKITGNLFVNSSICLFHVGGVTIYVASVFVSSQEILCVVPAFNVSGVVTLSVVADRTSPSSNSINLSYQASALPTVQTVVETIVGPGNIVTLVGNSFTNTTSCRFQAGSQTVTTMAIFVNNTVVQCVSPVMNATNVNISISNDGNTFSPVTTITYVNTTMPVVQAISQTNVVDGTVIIVTGDKFTNATICRFTSGGTIIDVQAFVTNTNQASCATPHFNSSALAQLSVTNDGIHTVPAGTISYNPSTVVVANTIDLTVVGPGNVITLTGTGFTNNSTCKFVIDNQQIVVQAVIINSTTVTCTVPTMSSSPNHTLQVSVSNNGVSYNSNAQPITYVTTPVPIIGSVDKSSLVPSTVVTVSGILFSNNATCVYSIGSRVEIVPAAFVSSAQIKCTTPEMGVNGTVSLQISNDGVNYSPKVSPSFTTAITPPTIASVDRTSTSPGTVITVSGSSFTNSSTCKFTSGNEQYVVSATTISSTQVTCTVPTFTNANATVTIQVSNDGTTYYGGTVITYTPLTATPAVPTTSIPSTTGIPITSGPSTAVPFDAIPTVSSIDKNIIAPGSTISVSGSEFTTNATCRFTSGDAVVTIPSVYVSSTEIKCPIPDLNTTTATLTLDVSNDGVQFTNTGSNSKLKLNYVQGLTFATNFKTIQQVNDAFGGDYSTLPDTLGPPQELTILQTTASDSYGDVKLMVSSVFNITGKKYRRAVMSTDLFPIVKQESFVDFSIDNATQYGDMVESWLWSASGDSFILGSLSGDADGKKYIKLSYNMTQASYSDRVPCTFTVNTNYRLIVKAQSTKAGWRFTTDLFFGKDTICSHTLTPIKFEPEKFFKSTFRVVLSQSTLGSQARRIQEDVIAMTIYVNSLGLQCQAGLCGNITLGSIVDVPTSGINLVWLAILSFGAFFVVTVICVLAFVIIGLLYCRYRKKTATVIVEEEEEKTLDIDAYVPEGYRDTPFAPTEQVKEVETVPTDEKHDKFKRAMRKMQAVNAMASPYSYSHQVQEMEKMRSNTRNRRDSLDENDERYRDHTFVMLTDKPKRRSAIAPIDEYVHAREAYKARMEKQQLKINLQQEEQNRDAIFASLTTPIKSGSSPFTPGLYTASPQTSTMYTPESQYGTPISTTTPVMERKPLHLTPLQPKKLSPIMIPDSHDPLISSLLTPSSISINPILTPSPMTPSKELSHVDQTIKSKKSSLVIDTAISHGEKQHENIFKKRKNVVEKLEIDEFGDIVQPKSTLSKKFTPMLSPLLAKKPSFRTSPKEEDTMFTPVSPQNSSLTPGTPQRTFSKSDSKKALLQTPVTPETPERSPKDKLLHAAKLISDARKFSLAQRLVEIEDAVQKRSSVIQFTNDSDSDEEMDSRDANLTTGLNKFAFRK